MKLCFQFDLWRPSLGHLEQGQGSVKHRNELSACRKDSGNLAVAEGPEEPSIFCEHQKPCRKKTNKQAIKSHKMVPQSLG